MKVNPVRNLTLLDYITPIINTYIIVISTIFLVKYLTGSIPPINPLKYYDPVKSENKKSMIGISN